MSTPRANERLARQLDAEDEGQALVQSTMRRIRELKNAEGYNPTGAEAQSFETERIRLQEKLTDLQTRHQNRAALNASIRGWLQRLPASAVVEDVKLPKVKLPKGENHLDAVDRIRGELSTLMSERLNVLKAGLPRDEMHAQCRKWVVEQAMNATPRIRAGHDGFSVSFSSESMARGNPSIADMLCFLLPDVMTKRLIQEVDAMPVPGLVLTPTAKAKKLDDIKVALLALERQEEEHILAGEEEHQYIPRRPGAAPESVLGIVLVNAKGKVAA